MTARCRATKANGEGCRAPATGQHGFCWAHSPENAEKRRRTASKGGRAKRSRDADEVMRAVQGVIDGVLAGTIERGVGAVALQGYNVQARLIDLRRKIKETDELEARIQELERQDEQPRHGRWRA